MARSPAYRAIVTSEREVKHLRAEKAQLLADLRALQSKHDSLAPNLARLRQAFWDLKTSLALGVLGLTVGGILISVAGALTDPNIKSPLLFLGIGIGSLGLVTACLPMLTIRDKDV